MKNYTNEELKKILDDMKKGVVYIGIYNNCGVGKISIEHSFIKWDYYGKGETMATVYSFRWLLENAFYNCDLIVPAKYSKYHTNYIPKDKKYNGVDISTRHKNNWKY